jgi:hypothetical protein
MQSTIPANATKAQELEHLAAFVRALPAGSYLASMFPPETLAEAQRLITADLIPDSLADSWKIRAQQQAETSAELAAGAKRREQLRAELADMERQRRRLADQIDELRAAARTLAALAAA